MGWARAAAAAAAGDKILFMHHGVRRNDGRTSYTGSIIRRQDVLFHNRQTGFYPTLLKWGKSEKKKEDREREVEVRL